MKLVIESLIGNLQLIEHEGFLTEVNFTKEPVSILAGNEILNLSKSQFDEYFASSRKSFDLPLKLTGTEFQKRVWQQLLLIPYGSTISYQELANLLSDPKCIRAAARANGQNLLPIIIPCHRVIGSNGEMTGYAGGIARKKDLLRLEGAEIMNQMNLF